MTTTQDSPAGAAATRQAESDAARLLLARMGITAAELAAAPVSAKPMPTFATYVPVVAGLVSAGSARMYGTKWGDRRLDEPTPSEIKQLMADVRVNVVVRRNARGGRSAAEHFISALRCLYRHAEDDGLINRADNPALKVAKPPRLPSTRRAVADTRLAEINQVAATTGNDPALDTLLLRLHTETACRRGGALALRRSTRLERAVLDQREPLPGHFRSVTGTVFLACSVSRCRRADRVPAEQRPRIRRCVWSRSVKMESSAGFGWWMSTVSSSRWRAGSWSIWSTEGSRRTRCARTATTSSTWSRSWSWSVCPGGTSVRRTRCGSWAGCGGFRESRQRSVSVWQSSMVAILARRGGRARCAGFHAVSPVASVDGRHDHRAQLGRGQVDERGTGRAQPRPVFGVGVGVRGVEDDIEGPGLHEGVDAAG